MNLHKLYCFSKVVEEGSISKAAVKLNMTQPPLSILIKSFEKELGIELFERRKKRLFLTDVGELLYKRSKDIFDLTSQVNKEIYDQATGNTGVVKIGCSNVANLTLLPAVIEKLRKETKDIVVKVSEGNSQFIIKELRNKNIDIGIIRNVFDAEDLDFSTIITEPLLLALPSKHKLLDKKSIELSDLKNENFLIQSTTLGKNISDVIIESCYKDGFHPNIIYWGTNSLPILDMVKRGLGIAFVPSTFNKIKGIQLPPLLKIHDSEFSTNLMIVTLKDKYLSAAVKRTIDITTKEMKTLLL